MPDGVDGDLLERFVGGDQDAFETLFRRFELDVHRWIARIVRDASVADDVLVEGFWRAYRARARFDVSRSFGAWVRRIATNAALDAIRARRRDAWTRVDESQPAAAGPDREVRLNAEVGIA
jgi:RNA polymerase sigma-70 factor (ECF subfamily)